MTKRQIKETLRHLEEDGDVTVVSTSAPGRHVRFLVEYRNWIGQPTRRWLSEETAINVAAGLSILV